MQTQIKNSGVQAGAASAFFRACPWSPPLALFAAFVSVCGGLAWLFGLSPSDPALFASPARLCLIAAATLCAAALLLLLLFLAASRAVSESSRRLALSIPLALAAVYAAAAPTSALFVSSDYKGILWIAALALCAMMIHRALGAHAEKRVKAYAFLLGGLFAVCLAIGRQVSLFGGLGQCFRSPYTAAVFLLELSGLFILFSALLLLALRFCLSTDFRREGQSGFFTRKRSIPLIAGAMLLCWLPYLAVCYPGIQTPDSAGEIFAMLWMEDITNHHPVIHQLTIKPFLMLGEALGSLSAGCFFYSLFQMLVLSCIFAFAVWYMGKIGLKPCWRFLLFGFYALGMLNAAYSITMWKDVLFGGFTLLLTLLLMKETRTEQKTLRGSRLKRTFSLLGLTAACFLFCVYRNNGFYAFLLAFPLYLLCNRTNWRRLCLVFLSTLLLVFMYQYVIFDCMGVRKSSSGEALSLPLQQIARTVWEDGESVTQEDYDALDEFFTDARRLGKSYDARIADPVKGEAAFNARAFDQNPLGFFRLWLRLGVKHPVSYATAFLNMSLGYWYPDEYADALVNGLHPNGFGIEQVPSQQPARDAMLAAFEAQRRTPVLSMLYSIGFMVWLAVFTAALLLCKRKGRLASPMLFLSLTWLTTLASPMYCEYRYIYGLIVSVPACLGLALAEKENALADAERPEKPSAKAA